MTHEGFRVMPNNTPQNFLRARMAPHAGAAWRWFGANGAIAFALVAAGLIVYVNVLFWFYTQWTAALHADSWMYIGWHPLRTAGYPAIIRVVFRLTDDLRWLSVVQLNALLLSYIVLAYAFARLTSRAYGLGVMLLLFCIVPLISLSQNIATESMFVSMICLHLAALCCYLRRQTARMAFYLGSTLIVMYLIRPNGLPFFATLALLPVIASARVNVKRRVKHVCIAVAPIIVGVALAASVNKFLNDAFTPQLGSGHYLLMHVSPLLGEGDGDGTRYARLLDGIEKASRAKRDNITSADWPHAYWAVSSGAVHGLLHDYFRDDILDFLGLTGLREMSGPGRKLFKRRVAVEMDLALMIIKARPMAYLKHVAAHYYGLWRGGFLKYDGDLPAEAARRYLSTKRQYYAHPRFARYMSYVMDGAYLVDETVAARYDGLARRTTLPGLVWRTATRNRDLTVAAIYLLSWAALALLLTKHRRYPPLLFTAYMAFLLHANTLFIAAVHPGIHRYTLPLLPVLVLLLVGVVASAMYMFGKSRMARQEGAQA